MGALQHFPLVGLLHADEPIVQPKRDQRTRFTLDLATKRDSCLPALRSIARPARLMALSFLVVVNLAMPMFGFRVT